MAGLTRYTQQTFGTSAGSNQMGQFGSRIASPPGNLYSGATINPAIVQSLSNFLEGLYSSLGGSYSPPIQDQNSLFFLAFYQLSYLLTRGIPEWDAGTTYNLNDFCKVGNVLYYSLIDSNTNNNPGISPSEWRSTAPIAPTQQIFTSGSGTYTAPALRPLFLRIQMVGGGGGGSGAVADTVPVSLGGNGSATTFGTSQLIANGGGGSQTNGGGTYIIGAGGTASFSTGYGNSFIGQDGSTGMVIFAIDTSQYFVLNGGNGGQNLFGGGGIGGGPLTASKNAIANSGAGGGGGSSEVNGSDLVYAAGAGGAAGGYLDVIIPNPSSSYAYSVGTGGAGGAGHGTNSNAGSNGAAGKIVVTEYYQ